MVNTLQGKIGIVTESDVYCHCRLHQYVQWTWSGLSEAIGGSVPILPNGYVMASGTRQKRLQISMTKRGPCVFPPRLPHLT